MGLFIFRDGEHQRKSNVAIAITVCERSLMVVTFHFRRLPNPLVYLSYIFYFQGILVGPLCFYADYIAFIEGSNFQVKKDSVPTVEANGEKV